MAESLSSTLPRLTAKAQMLTERCRSQASELERQADRVAELEQALKAARRENAALQQQVEFLRAARALDKAADGTSEARAMIARMLREIDMCIKQLTY